MKIYTLCDKRPDFIKIQLDGFNKFCADKHDYIVLNNGSNCILRLWIKCICRILSVSCIEVLPQKYADPAMACAIPLQWAYEKYIKPNREIVCLIDSDMFLISQMNFRDYVSKYDIAGVPQSRSNINYLWNGILVFNNIVGKRDFNLLPTTIDGQSLDVGGGLYYWIKKHKPSIRNIHHTSHIKSANHNISELPLEIRKIYKDEYTFEIYDKKFLHYGRGSNWAKESFTYHIKKTILLRKFVNKMISNELRLPT